jgi:hypothetical protein
MKLTKSQRLFIKAGEAQASMEYYKWCENQSLFDDEDDDGVILVTDIAKYRKLRKQLIREALEAYETEKLVAQAWTYERGFCAGRRINKTTKTQHT